MRRALSVVVLFVMASCAPDDLLGNAPPMGCVSDAMEACACPDGAMSTRTCQADGTFAACVCPDAEVRDVTTVDVTASVALSDATALDVVLDAPRDVAALDAPPDARPDVIAPDVMDAPRPDATLDAPGCDADLATSALHCGACGRACAAGEVCVAARCVAPMAVCPATCATTAECAPCSRPGEGGGYCCMSSVCVYVATGVCAAAPDAGSDATSGGDAVSGGDALVNDAPSGGDASMGDAGSTGPG